MGLNNKMLRIANWGEYQHYKDRNPPWIKLHYELISSRAWVMLDDASRCLAVASMLIASRNDGEIPADPEYVRRVAYLNGPADFKPLIDIGFIEDASGCYQMLADARPETEAEEETETEDSLSDSEIGLSDAQEPTETIEDRFAELWDAYGYKSAKKDALKAYRTTVGTKTDLHNTIMSALPAYLAATSLTGDRQPRRKLLAGWLRSERWLDEDHPGAMTRETSVRVSALAEQANRHFAEAADRERRYGHIPLWDDRGRPNH